MPIYAYKCESCGHAKDVLQKMSDAVLTDCPACGASTFKKQLTAAGFQLKGSGWYVTDFKGGAAGAASGDKTGAAAEATAGGKADTSAPAGSGGGDAATKADTKIETKPAAPSEAKAAPPSSATPAASSK